tara:strand:+ start:163 stop:1293 length:1131 start_codon:yes stop_codon:yes gene_type:complete
MKTFLKIFLIFFVIDFLITSTILKKFEFLPNGIWEDQYWRIESDIYHHDLLPNIDIVENWGFNLKKRLVTNSLGFRDFSNKNIEKETDKKRVLLIGDSFIEGAGYDYAYTIGGLLQNYLGDDFEILNSAVSSYSPSIYYKKINHYLSKGYKFDQALIFLDVSDIYDELFIKFDENENIIIEIKKSEQTLIRKIKNRIYNFGYILRDNTVTFRFIYLLSDKTEILKNYIKLKIKASKILDKSLFNTNRNDTMYYRMTHIDRGYWTFDENSYFEVQDGLQQSEKYLKKLFKLLDENNIKSNLIVYPWPTQIQFGDTKHIVHWKNFSEFNNINFVSLYDVFQSVDKRKLIFDNFIYGDIHWNKKGTLKVFNEIINKIKF